MLNAKLEFDSLVMLPISRGKLHNGLTESTEIKGIFAPKKLNQILLRAYLIFNMSASLLFKNCLF